MINDKSFSSILLAAIVVTFGLLVSVHFFPEKRLVMVPDGQGALLLLSRPLPDGTVSSEWLNNTHTSWQCNYPEDFHEIYFPCGWTIDISKSGVMGVDLSRYDDMLIKLNYTGNANKVRVAIRNFNPDYSNTADGNSTKFNAVQLHTKALNK